MLASWHACHAAELLVVRLRTSSCGLSWPAAVPMVQRYFANMEALHGGGCQQCKPEVDFSVMS